jgi:hypothetical protein
MTVNSQKSGLLALATPAGPESFRARLAPPQSWTQEPLYSPDKTEFFADSEAVPLH